MQQISEYPKDPTNEAEALQTLAEFARTAPGCLPSRVMAALRIAQDRLAVPGHGPRDSIGCCSRCGALDGRILEIPTNA